MRKIKYQKKHIDKNRYDHYYYHIDKNECEDAMVNNYSDNAKIFKAFCDESRLRILELLEDGEVCACKLLESLSISQSTLSHHMKILIESGIVSGRKEGKWTHYSICADGADYDQRLLKEILRTREGKGEGNKCCNL